MTHPAIRSLNKVCAGLAAIALVALFALQGPAYAGGAAADVPSIVVSYAELNLNSTSGVDRLYHRIVSAAQRVCGPPVDNMNIGALLARKRCVSEAIERAVVAVDAPALNRYFAMMKGARLQAELTARSGSR